VHRTPIPWLIKTLILEITNFSPTHWGIEKIKGDYASNDAPAISSAGLQRSRCGGVSPKEKVLAQVGNAFPMDLLNHDMVQYQKANHPENWIRLCVLYTE